MAVPSGRKGDTDTKQGLGVQSHHRRGHRQGERRGEWGSEGLSRSHLESRSRIRRSEGTGSKGSRPPSLHVPRYLLNAQEPDILPYDLFWGELEGKDSGEFELLRMGGKDGRGARHLWDTGAHGQGELFQFYPHQSSIGGPGPHGDHMDTHTQRWPHKSQILLPRNILKTGQDHVL